MQNNDYVKHMKNIGMAIYGYDYNHDASNPQVLNLSRLADQWATGNVADQDYVNVLAQKTTGLQTRSFGYGEGIHSLVRAYMQTDAFLDTLSHIPANNSLQAIIEAWAADAVADGKTFTTLSGTGFIHFMDLLYGSAFSSSTGSDIAPFPESDTPTYADGTYCTNTVS